MLLLLAIVGCAPEEIPVDTDFDIEVPRDDHATVDAAWEDRFAAGDHEFNVWYRSDMGIGPLFIRQSCGGCHANGARGNGVVEKMVVLDEDGDPVPDALPYGNTVRRNATAGARHPILPPDVDGLLLTVREGPAMFGRGYLEAIEESEILRVEASQTSVSGRANHVPWASAASVDARGFHVLEPGDVAIGRFGLKGRVATVDEFVADAMQGDMSITSPLRPDELPNPDGVTDDRVRGIDATMETVDFCADYVRLLDIPPRDDLPGADRFADLGCADCHVPSMKTRADYPIAALAGIDAPVYTDLLLHDMGSAFDDGLRDGEATGREWKTAPLIGLRLLHDYLHDGRALTVDEAIVQHGGDGSEAAPSVQRYQALDEASRAEVLAFVASR